MKSATPRCRILAFFILLASTQTAMASAPPPEVNCGDGLFTVSRVNAFHGDYFIWQFAGHLFDHFAGNQILTKSTRVRVASESWYGMSIDGARHTASVNAGSSYNNDTKLATVLQNGTISYLLTLVKDTNSQGYFLRAFYNTGDPKQQRAEYYFQSCTFSPAYPHGR